MGPVLVATMVQGGVGERPPEKLHPFFTKGTDKGPVSTSCVGNDTPDAKPMAVAGRTPDLVQDGRHTKRRKTDCPVDRDASEAEKPRQREETDGVAGAASINHSVAAPPPTGPGLAIAATLAAQSRRAMLTKQPGLPLQPTSSAPAQTLAVQGVPQTATKVLKFNPKTGTLGSPPKPKQKRNASLIAKLRYGRDEQSRKRIGHTITQILAGELKVPAIQEKMVDDVISDKNQGPPAVQAQATVKKALHPFFSGRPRQIAPVASEPARPPNPTPARSNTVFTSTPVSPRNPRTPLLYSKPPKPAQFGIKSLGVKIAGAMHPMWPPAGMSHVRGEEWPRTMAGVQLGAQTPKKSKGQVTTVTASESVVTHLVSLMNIGSVRLSLPTDDDSFPPAPAELRLPTRRFESGRKLQTRVRKQLGKSSLAGLANVDESSDDELSHDARPVLHPAIHRHYHSLKTQLSAFDTSSCESLAWTQKYAPVAAAQVLQSGKETSLLRQWLLAMKVQSVETGGDANGDKSKGKADGALRRKRRKNRLDSFVVDSSGEESELDEL